MHLMKIIKKKIMNGFIAFIIGCILAFLKMPLIIYIIVYWLLFQVGYLENKLEELENKRKN